MKEVAIGIALANVQDNVDHEEVLSFLKSKGVGIEVYERAPVPPGTIMAAAIDWTLVLTAIGTAASLASVLWMAYERFIAPKKGDKDKAGIVIVLKKGDGTSDTFWIGNSHRDQDAFIDEFSHKVEKIKNTNANGECTESVIDETRWRHCK